MPFSRMNSWGICTRIPAPSPVLLSEPSAPRCAICSRTHSPCSTTEWYLFPLMLTTSPTPQASCSHSGRYNPPSGIVCSLFIGQPDLTATNITISEKKEPFRRICFEIILIMPIFATDTIQRQSCEKHLRIHATTDGRSPSNLPPHDSADTTPQGNRPSWRFSFRLFACGGKTRVRKSGIPGNSQTQSNILL